MWRWLVIIARDRPELWVTWVSFYGAPGKVEVLFDRRQGQPWPRSDRSDRRTQPHGETDLEGHGFLVIPRPEMVSESR